MKKLISMLLVVVMAMSMMSVSGVLAADINVTIDGKAQSYDVMPVIENGRTLVPMRAIFEALGAKMKVNDTADQLSGVGFSSTKRNDLIVKVVTDTEQVLKIKF